MQLNKVHHWRINTRIAALLCTLTLFIGACGAFEIGIEHVPPGNEGNAVNWQATAEALQAEVTRASDAIQVASPLSTAEPAPTQVPVTVPLAPGYIAQDRAAVAYVQGGDIWVKTLPNGEPLRLTFDGKNRSPRWSASGQWLSFLKEPEFSQLWIMRHDGTDGGQLGNMSGNSYAWSPVDDTIAFGETGGINLLMPETGLQPVLQKPAEPMPPTAVNRLREIAWSPDGKQLAYTMFQQPFDNSQGNDSLWLTYADEGTPIPLLEGDLPDRGEILLHSWSGNGRYVIFWQAQTLSASILADGVPLYRVPAAGGTPEILAESVVPHENSVQSQPLGLPQVAIVEGSGREMWHNKQLRALTIDGAQSWALSLPDQAASSPVWLPDGSTLAYIGMPDIEGVSGDEAKSALMQRQLWIREAGVDEPRMVGNFQASRIDAVQWLDNETLLVASLSLFDEATLTVVHKSGDQSQSVQQLTPAPEWFGFYGHIDWHDYFAVWRPTTFAEPVMTLPPTAVPFAPLPTLPEDLVGHKLSGFLQTLHPAMTLDEARTLYGEPDRVTESGLIINQYHIGDEVWLWLGFPYNGPLTYAELHAPTGQVVGLTFMTIDPSLTPPAPTATPTPDRTIITLTPTPAVEPTLVPRPTATVPLAAPTSLPPTATPPPIAREYVVHTVKERESIMSIANDYGVTAEQIMEVNGLRDPDVIRIGDELIIPVLPTPAATPVPTSTRTA